MDLDDAIRNLRDMLAANTNATDIARAVEDVARHWGTGSVRGLASLLDDANDRDEVMFEVVHAIEQFDDNSYVRELVKGAEALLSSAPRWTTILFLRVVNSDLARARLIAEVATASQATRHAVRTILEMVAARSEDLKGKAESVLGTMG